MARLKRLNESGLRRLVRGMLQEMGMAPMTRDQAITWADSLLSEYLRAIDDAYRAGDHQAEDAIRNEFHRRFEREIRPMLPRLNAVAKDVRVVADYDDDIEIHVLDVNGKRIAKFNDLVGFVDAIDWRRPALSVHPRVP